MSDTRYSILDSRPRYSIFDEKWDNGTIGLRSDFCLLSSDYCRRGPTRSLIRQNRNVVDGDGMMIGRPLEVSEPQQAHVAVDDQAYPAAILAEWMETHPKKQQRTEQAKGDLIGHQVIEKAGGQEDTCDWVNFQKTTQFVSHQCE